MQLFNQLESIMNIFLLSYERNAHKHFAEQAAFHCDKHVIKMIAESTQMLVTALSPLSPVNYSHYLSDKAITDMPCKPLGKAHAKHPCMIWTAANINHVYYLLRLALALCSEKQHRWPLNPDHAYHAWLLKVSDDFELLGFRAHDPLPETFAIATKRRGLANIHSISRAHHEVVTIYRDYYVSDKASIAKWKTHMPMWFDLALEQQAATESLTTSGNF
jgi:hypothetical protein